MDIKTDYNWYSLDNTAKMYPMVTTNTNQNLYRLTFEMTDEVEPENLTRALEDIMPRFPTFNVKLKKGLFWYYFEENTNKPIVTENDGVLMKHIKSEENKKFLFNVSYWHKLIIIEFYHILCDGKGALEFGKALTFRYLLLTGHEVYSENKVITIESPPTTAEVEDSFRVNSVETRLKDIDVKAIRGEKAYRIDGTTTSRASLGFINATMPLDAMLALAHKYNVSLTTYISALILYSIYQVKIGKKQLKKPLLVFIPIDLRKYYNSKTLRNFVMYSRAGIHKGDSTDTFENFIKAVERDLKHDLTKESFENKLNGSVKLQTMPIPRFIPLTIKSFLYKVARQFFSSNHHTITFSNVGPANLPESMEPYVENLYFTLNVSPLLPVSVGANSYKNKLNIGFTRMILETDIEKYFFRHLTSEGIEVELTSNMWEL